jgi:hypothetical protein
MVIVRYSARLLLVSWELSQRRVVELLAAAGGNRRQGATAGSWLLFLEGELKKAFAFIE